MPTKMLSLAIILLFSFNLHSQESKIVDAFKSFKSGQYQETIDKLQNIKGNQETLSAKYYLQGICQNKLQNFDLAIPLFLKSIRLKNQSKDLYYELGQAYYATSSIEKAGKAFGKSYQLKYKKASSLYYMAHIYQVLEKYKYARKYFKKLIKEEKKDKSLRQVATFQFSESTLRLVENKSNARELVKKQVIPTLENAVKIMPSSAVAKDIQKRINEIKIQFALDPNIMLNGKRLSDKRYNLSLTQLISYDNNITLATDVPTSQATEKDSFIFSTTAKADYLINIKNRYTVKPNIEYKNENHGDRENSEVYTNDTYSIIGGFDNTLEHKLFSKQASLLFNISYNYTGRDRDTTKDKIFYARSITYTLGEKFKFFSFGKTGIKLKYKDYLGYQDSLHNKTKTFSFDQVKITSTGKLFIFFFQADFTDSYNDITSSTNNYLFRTDYLYPEILPNYTLNLAMAISFLDTKLQSTTRGTEKSYSPSFKLTKNISKRFTATAGYTFTKNTSLNETSYSYTKSVYEFEVKYSF